MTANAHPNAEALKSVQALVMAHRLDAVLFRRKGVAVDEHENVACEVCGQNIHRYIGPNPGVVCSSCLEPSGEAECVRVMPLAITRSSIREH